MASNFRICSHRNSDKLYLDLVGDFDGSSAYELLNILKEKSERVNKIYIDTNSLKTVYVFGLNVFQNLAFINGLADNLVFTGKNGHKIASKVR